jgi:glucose/arabinose dehydrogenase
MRYSRLLAIPLLAAVALLAFSGPGRVGLASSPLVNPIPATIQQGSVPIRLTTVATGLTAPTGGTFAPGDSQRIFVTDQNGIVWAITTATGVKTVFLDVTGRLVPLGVFGPGTFDERGLLGLAFSPNYQINGLIYTFDSEPVSGLADFSTVAPGTANAQSVIAEWHVPNPASPLSVVDTSSRRELLRIDKPQFNHNGGGLSFGPDSYLYISVGDGGGADDQDGEPFIGGPTVGHGSTGNGQNTSVVLGKLLRIDPAGNNSANGKYGIPPSNPFFSTPGFAKEIYDYGLRNPWRFSFDQATGTMYIADVGQNNIEEIDQGIAGANYGWRYKEGSFFFDPNGTSGGFVTNVDPGVPAGLTDPIAEYDHDEGLAIIGGFVYRGSEIAQLYGKYVFGDFARTFSADGRLFYLDGGQIVEFPLTDRPALNLAVLGFAPDSSGNVYLLGNKTGVPFGSTGVVLKIAAPGVGGLVDVLTAGPVPGQSSDAFPGSSDVWALAAAVIGMIILSAGGWFAWKRAR